MNKIIKYFLITIISIFFLIIIIGSIFDPYYRYIPLRNKEDLTKTEQRLLDKYPYKNLYYMMKSDSTIKYYVYDGGVLSYEGGFYPINPKTGRKIRIRR